MFEPNASWSLPAHLFMVSEWSARCTQPNDPFSCTNALQAPGLAARLRAADGDQPRPTPDLRLDRPHLPAAQAPRRAGATTSSAGTEPDCEDDAAMSCAPVRRTPATPGIWNPLPYFDTRPSTTASSATSSRRQLLRRGQGAARCRRCRGSCPTGAVSEHPPAPVSAGQAYVTEPRQRGDEQPRLEVAPRSSSPGTTGAASTTTSPPPTVDANGYGLRVPGHRDQPVRQARATSTTRRSASTPTTSSSRTTSSRGQRLDPATDGRPDPRPTSARTSKILGDLTSDFDFGQKPRRPLILDPQPTTDLR